ncbi:MAG: transporter substrate-binding domain-containing protein, partial [Alphaproteobacteria bacterium]|nr:transporter substrate-binding domain-containing protein [Alphaproteobacteria bacterium]
PEFIASGPSFATQNQGVVMLKDPAMKVLVDQALDALRANGKLAAISQKWFGADVTR